MDFRTVACERGGNFGVIGVWIESQFLLVVIPPREPDRNATFMERPELVKQTFVR